MAGNPERDYRSTESKYEGGAEEMYVTYDVEQRTRGGGTALYPKVKRVYVPGDIKHWEVGDFKKRSGRHTHGVRIDYVQERSGYRRRGFDATRGQTHYGVEPASVKSTGQRFSHVVDVPERARNIQFHTGKPPERYQSALQPVR
jgi:hypothetical protein